MRRPAFTRRTNTLPVTPDAGDAANSEVTAGVVPTAGYAVPAVVPAGAVVTTNIPYRPMGPWIEGCVPDSIRYVPGRRAVQVNAVVAPNATSVENDCTRGPCAGGVPTPVTGAPGASPAMGQVSGWALVWSGAAVNPPGVPRPPPN